MQEIIIYTTTYCGYCTAAKRLLSQKGIAYREVDLTNDHELRQKLSDDNRGYRTVPMIFIGQEFIGGFQELAALDKTGSLAEKVGSA